jgi:short-subunit dehydrogenase
MTDANKKLLGKVIVITGASSGIGEAAAYKFAALGASVLLVARRIDRLNEVVQKITDKGGKAFAFPADLSDLAMVDQLGEQILANHPVVDVLINNAGHSIRRPFTESLDRFHDFERCMMLNYYSPLRLTRKLLPSMIDAKQGHIINSSTWGTLLPVTGFGPYNASKAALDSIAESMRAELRGKGIFITQIHFPLVHTAMSAATEMFQKLPGMSSEQAADWMVRAVCRRPAKIMDIKTKIAKWLYLLFPRTAEACSKKLPFSV